MKDKTKSLITAGQISGKVFLAKVKEQAVEKYAQDMVLILEDEKKLAKALRYVQARIKDVENGDFTAIEKYKKQRRRLEEVEDGEFE